MSGESLMHSIPMTINQFEITEHSVPFSSSQYFRSRQCEVLIEASMCSEQPDRLYSQCYMRLNYHRS